VRTVCLAGEPLTATLAAAIHRIPTVERLYNLYGPTEDTTYSTFALVAREDDGRDGTAPTIGRPLAGGQAYVLDARLEPVPIGMSGEVYLAGEGLARGYLHRAALTAERFVPNPFSEAAGARMYRTGDLARWRDDGDLDYLGRIDHQVKVRGYRIELGEVESAIEALDGVRATAVLAREDVPGDKRLVAYFVAASETAPALSALREGLLRKLPEYMVPSAFVQLEALPLTPNGKIDRGALPAPPIGGRAAGETVMAARTDTERRVVELLRQVLGVAEIGLGDDFVRLGGHSLLAARAVMALRQAFGAAVPIELLLSAATVERIAATVDALLAQGSPEPSAPIVPVDAAARVPSFAQERLWFLAQLEPQLLAYNIVFTVRLRGALQRKALERALTELVGRHDSLRMTFPAEGGRATVHVQPPSPVELPLVALTGGERDKLTELGRLERDEAKRPFDLERGPLLRAKLVRLARADHALIIGVHHIVADGWSAHLLVDELAALHAAFAEGLPSPLTPLPVGYADFAAWERTQLGGDGAAAGVEKLTRFLAGAPTSLELPTDRPRPAVRSSRGGWVSFALSAELRHRLEAWSRARGVTPFATLFSAWTALLARYSRQEDLLVGTPVANRTRSETEGLIGFFADTAVLRARPEAGKTFATLVDEVQAAAAAFAHTQVPLQRVVEALGVPRDTSRTPLFQTMFALQNAPVAAAQRGGLAIEVAYARPPASKFDLTLEIEPVRDGFAGVLEYSAELYDAATVRRMAEHFQMLLAGALEAPEAPLRALSLMGDVERRQLLDRWNDTAVDYTRDACAHELFEEQAARTPAAVAVECDGQRLTYRELDERANRLGHHLQSLGVGPGVRTGICVERSLDMVVGLLGILKAGGAYVPLDPAYPADRLAFMLEDARVPVLVTQRRLEAKLPAHDAHVVRLDDPQESAGCPTTPPPARVSADQLAYVLYTSGSTGQPKGVAIPHRGPVALIRWAQKVFSRDELAGVLFATSICFDLSVFELFVPLSVGGKVIVVANALALPKRAAIGDVTLLNTVPSAAQELVRSGGLPPSVRTVCLAGEPLTATLAEALHRIPTVERLYNLYGPTEDTTYSTFTLVPRDGTAPTIGRALENGQAYVLDASFEPVPIGVSGEVHLAGEGLARGYLHRPALTAERFVPCPFTNEPGARMYRTGDLARWRDDGNLEYLGRMDHQVKVRGYRIELGEIESALEALDGIRATAVLAREDSPGDKRLVAYIVAAGEPAPTAAELRERLASQLPDYMVPSAFVRLDALPMTPNGKIDRTALGRSGPAAVDSEAAFVAPRTDTERTLAQVFAEVLRLPRVGVDDDFFALGGHSLLGTQVISRARAVLDVELPVRALFERRTVARLAEVVDAARAGSTPSGAAPIRAGDRQRAFPLSFSQERLWFLDRLDPGQNAWHVPFALRMRGKLARAALERAVVELLRRHEVLRSTYADGEDEPSQILGAIPVAPPRFVDLGDVPAAAREAELQRLLEREAGQPFDLVAGPICRVILVRSGDEDHTLSIVTHHIAFDGWSMGVVAEELAALYRAFANGQPSPLEPLGLAYADFAVWQRQHLRGEVLVEQVAYWKQALAGAPLVLPLPLDRPRRAVNGRLRGRPIAIDRRVYAALEALGRREGATPFMAMLAALQILLARYTGQDDILIGTPIANRHRPELEPLVGFFVNTLVLRGRIDGADGFRAILRQARETALSAYQYQELPFQHVVEAMHVDRDPHVSPLFQTMFTFHNTPASQFEMDGLTVEGFPIQTEHSQYDLSIEIVPDADGIKGAFEYNADLFDDETIGSLVDNFAVLLTALVEQPDVPVARLPLVTAGEQHRLTRAWNETTRSFPAYDSMAELFAAQAARTPRAVAVRCNGRALTYAELNAQAEQLAHVLGARGIGRESIVALRLPRGIDLVVAILGVFKAGAAYLPLDPEHPEKRQQEVIDDSGAALVVSALDQIVRPCEPVSRSRDRALPSSLAYVIYTSGSTGKPKGAMVEQRGMLNHLYAKVADLELTAGDVVAQTAPACFDISVWQMLAPLAVGGCVEVLGEETVRDPVALLDEIDACRISVVEIVPSMLRAILDEIELRGKPAAPLNALRWMIATGEALPADLCHRWSASFPDIPLLNAYGPTECSDDVTHHRVAADDGFDGPVPIGRPIANTQLYVLDAELQPVPRGVAGDLYVGGVGVGRGYVGDPVRTAPVFLPDPFAVEPGARLYRTGDRGRHRADGALQFLGRNDAQVKVRGHRIELGEIESRLRKL
ncbi:MAG: Malonyl CoA-acyl carrier protein transacylase, partial [Myxococcales bacterium]|nr:Malonyl CoA-acyl carrier protein transacylase [Myxococcales bacterium]